MNMDIKGEEARLYITCVIYNKLITDIVSLNTFMRFSEKFDFIKIIILDNSSNEYVHSNHALCNEEYKEKIIYVNNHGNIGLSKAYNKALNIITDRNAYIMFSDDDTLFSDEYMENVIRVVKKGRVNIIGGIVRTSKIILSPAKKLAVRFKTSQELYINRPGIYRNIFCINSGLVVKRKIYDIVGKYDERLFLDAVDLLFADKLIDHKLNIFMLVDGNISQNFSGESNNLNSRKIRTKIMTRDWIMWWKIEHKHFFLIFISILITNASLWKRIIFNRLGISQQ